MISVPPGSGYLGAPLSLLTRLVVPLRLQELLLVPRRERRPVDGERQLVELASEAERNLVVLVVHWRFGVGTHVEVLVPLKDEWQRVLHLLACDLLAVDLEHPRTALADAAQVVEGERPHAEAVVLEVELDSVLAGGHGVGSLPADALQVEEVPQEHW